MKFLEIRRKWTGECMNASKPILVNRNHQKKFFNEWIKAMRSFVALYTINDNRALECDDKIIINDRAI